MHQFPIPDKDTARVFVFKQDASAVMENLEHRKGRIRRAGARVRRKRVDDRLDALLQGRAFLQHPPENLACQRGEHVRAHAAAHAVGKHQNIRILPVDKLNPVAAENLTDMVEAPAGHFRRDIHDSSAAPLCRSPASPEALSVSAFCAGLAYFVFIFSFGFFTGAETIGKSSASSRALKSSSSAAETPTPSPSDPQEKTDEEATAQGGYTQDDKGEFDEETQAREMAYRNIPEDAGGLLRAFIRKEYNKNRYGDK